MDQLSCATCSKTFPSAMARARHQLRCKARPRSRKKACQQCTRSKVRCDNQVPSCGRCGVMQLPCAYSRGTPAGPEAASSAPDLAAIPLTPLSDEWPHVSHEVPPDGWAVGGMPEWESQPLSLGLADTYLLDTGAASVQARYAAPDTSTHTLEDGSSPFASLSGYLAERWTTVEQGLAFVDAQCKRFADALLRGEPPPFIHALDWDPRRRHKYLLPVESIAQLYAWGAPGSQDVLLTAIDAQMQQVQVNLAKHSVADDIAAMQAVLVYSAMRIYRSSSVAGEMMDRISMRLCQHLLSKHSGRVNPCIDVEPHHWESWVVDESLYRCAFALHSLDYVSAARQGVPTALCGLFAGAPLPCPEGVWRAPGPGEWAVRHGEWRAQCGGETLKGSDILSWVRGKETGREGPLEAWFRKEEAYGGILLVCGRAQGAMAGIDGTL